METNESEAAKMEEDAVAKEANFFPVLGAQGFAAPQKLAARTPDWITNARRIPSRLDADPRPLGDCAWSAALGPALLPHLGDDDVRHWFPVQAALIPALLADAARPPLLPPRDLCVSAPTGSGKTLAYALPLISILRSRLVPATRALVMAPLSDLAAQVHAVLKRYAADTQLSVTLLTGQRDLQAETAKLQRGVPPDIIVATPGRLLDHLLENEGLAPADRYLSLSQLRYLVIDEADRMLADGHCDWLASVDVAVFGPKGSVGPRRRVGLPSYRNLRAAQPPLQKLLFSATLSRDPSLLAAWGLFMPKLIAVEGDASPDEQQTGIFAFPPQLVQQYIVCEMSQKPLVVFQLLSSHPEWKRVLCFVGSKEKSHRLSLLLTGLGLASVVELGGQLKAKRRAGILRRFAKGETRVVIASDLGGRGLDVGGVDVVLNYAPPTTAQAYAHRLGRTARAGKGGTGLSVLAKEELAPFQELLEQSGWWSGVEALEVPSGLAELKESYKAALGSLKSQLRTPMAEARRKRRPK